MGYWRLIVIGSSIKIKVGADGYLLMWKADVHNELPYLVSYILNDDPLASNGQVLSIETYVWDT